MRMKRESRQRKRKFEKVQRAQEKSQNNFGQAKIKIYFCLEVLVLNLVFFVTLSMPLFPCFLTLLSRIRTLDPENMDLSLLLIRQQKVSDLFLDITRKYEARYSSEKMKVLEHFFDVSKTFFYSFFNR